MKWFASVLLSSNLVAYTSGARGGGEKLGSRSCIKYQLDGRETVCVCGHRASLSDDRRLCIYPE